MRRNARHGSRRRRRSFDNSHEIRPLDVPDDFAVLHHRNLVAAALDGHTRLQISDVFHAWPPQPRCVNLGKFVAQLHCTPAMILPSMMWAASFMAAGRVTAKNRPAYKSDQTIPAIEPA